MRKKILIIGGRPDPILINCDVAYFINGSVEHANKLSDKTYKVHIITTTGLTITIKNYKTKDPNIHQIRLANYVGAKVNKTIYVDEGDEKIANEYLSKVGYKTESTENITNAIKQDIIYKITGKRPPIGVTILPFYSLKAALSKYKKLYNIYRLRKKNHNKMWPSDFMPSNGVFALLHSILIYGANHDYLLSGISLTPYNYEYKAGNKKFVIKELRRHYVADKIILKCLDCLSIASDDESVLKRTTFKVMTNQI